MNVLDWLLGDDTPGVQYLARTRLLGESAKGLSATGEGDARNRYLSRKMDYYRRLLDDENFMECHPMK